MTEVSPAPPEVWVGHPSHWHYFWWWLLGIILAPVVIGLIIIVWILIDRNRKTYTIAPDKVVLEIGILNKDSDELRIKDIRAMAVKRRGISGLAGIGTIEFSSAAQADAEIVFTAVPEVERVRDLVRRYQGATA